jgi:hypothetical protein
MDIDDNELDEYILKVKQIEDKIILVYNSVNLNNYLKSKYDINLHWANEQYNELVTWQITEDIYSESIYNLIFG